MTILVNNITAQYRAFRISDAGDGTEDGYIADGPQENDADGDGRISFLESLHERYRVVVREPLSSVEKSFPELPKDQQMELFFKAVEAGEQADLFISLCRAYYDIYPTEKELPPEDLQKALLQVVRERPEARVKEIEELIAWAVIESTESLERWLVLADHITSAEVGGIMVSLYSDQFSSWEIEDRLEHLVPLADELEQKFAVVGPEASSEPQVYNEADLNTEERKILEELESASGEVEILAVVSRHRQEVLPREIAYSGEDQVLSGQLNWNEVFGVFLQSRPGLKEKIIAELARQLKAADFEKDPEAYKQVLRSIPDRDMLDALLANYDLNLNENLPALWREARAIFGHISQGADKIDYARSLIGELEEQGIPWNTEFSARPLHVPVTFVNLNNMERQTTPGLVIPLSEEGKYILAIRNPRSGKWEGRVLSDRANTNILKAFWRQIFGESGESYFLAYYPKIHLSGGGMRVNIEYEAPERTYEHFVGKIAGDVNGQDYQKALENFGTAYGKEDEYLAEQMEEFRSVLPPGLLDKAREEEALEIDGFMNLVMGMDGGGAQIQIKELFGLSEEEFNDYQAKIEKILLETDEPLTPAEFLARAIEACDGRALLASALAYNLLFTRSGESSAGNLTAVYPNAFDWDSIEAEDKSGAVYHFMGTFFSSYGTQTCLVRRYYTDASFRDKIDGLRETLLKKLTKEEGLDFADEELQAQLLTLTQYLLLSKGNIRQREVFTLAGIFKEEVMEDQDTSNEVYHDFRGMAAGHAFYEMVWGENLTPHDEFFSLNDDRRAAFVDLLSNSSNPTEMPLGTMLRAGALLFGLDGLAFSKFI